MCFFEINIMRYNGGVYQVSADTLKPFAEWIQIFLTLMPVERDAKYPGLGLADLEVVRLRLSVSQPTCPCWMGFEPRH